MDIEIRLNHIKLLIGLVAIVVLLGALSSCDKMDISDCVQHTVSPCNEDISKINISIRNVSKNDFCNVILNPNGQVTNYGIILSNESTCFRSFDLAYSYASLQLSIRDKLYTFQPFDYVGEVPLDIGNHVYNVDVVDDKNGELSISVE